MKREKDIFDRFLKFEEDHSVYDIYINGIPIWERVRRDIYSALITEDSHSTDAKGIKSKIIESIKGIGLWSKNIIHKNPYFSGQHNYLFWGHQRRKLQDDGLWWDLYFDPFYDEVDLDYIHLEVAHSTSHLTPAKTDNLRYMDFPVYAGTIARKIFGSVSLLDTDDRSTLQSLESSLHDEFGVQIDLLAMINRELVQRKVRKPLYRLLLRRIQPEVVVLVVSYHRETFIEVCKEMNIPVVELQHGVINSRHLEYSYSGDRPKLTFPDYLFVFGDYWKDVIEYPIPNENIYSVGYPYFEAQSQQYSDRESTDQVVFISQPTIGDQLSQFAVEFGEVSDLPVVYKLHPHEYDDWEDKYPHLEQSRVQVVCDEPQLYEILVESTMQVGVNSTVLYEGLNFDLDTYIFENVEIYLSQLIQTEYAEGISTVEDLSREIHSNNADEHDVSQFFKKNAIQNMEDALSDVVDRENNVSLE